MLKFTYPQIQRFRAGFVQYQPKISFPSYLLNHLKIRTDCPPYFAAHLKRKKRRKKYQSPGKIHLGNYIHLYFLTVPATISPQIE